MRAETSPGSSSSAETIAERKREVRSTAERHLGDADLLLPPGELAKATDDVHAVGAELWRNLPEARRWSTVPRDRRAGLDHEVLIRVLGFGHRQTEALGVALGSPSLSDAAARAGARFNLGISLFDYIADRVPHARSLMLSVLDRVTVNGLLDPAGPTLPLTREPVVDLLLGLVRGFAEDIGQLALPNAVTRQLQEMIRRLYEAELRSLDGYRANQPPDVRVWTRLREKSALPVRVMAVVAVAGPAPEQAAVRLSEAEAGLQSAGESLWIVDDLVDAAEDFEAGGWSRPWLLCSRSPQWPPEGAGEALALLIDAGVAAQESQSLVDALNGVLRSFGPGSSKCFRATVQSWLHELPARG